ncbi:hypothetical protein Tco_0580136 [Tanacetum coccineum]
MTYDHENGTLFGPYRLSYLGSYTKWKWSGINLHRYTRLNQEDHLAKFHKITDAKEMWEAIKSRFGGNDESKKMQNCPQLDHEDLEQLDEFDLEEMDLKWQVAMISMRMKKFYKKTGRKAYNLMARNQFGFDKLQSSATVSQDIGILAKECRSEGESRWEEDRSLELWPIRIKRRERSVNKKDSKALLVTAKECMFVPPPMTGNYMPSGPDIEIDYSQFTYGPKQSQTSESETQTSDFDTCESDCSVETHESLPEPTVNEPKVVSQPKVWSDAPIIEEYESDSEDEHVSLPTEEQETPSFANQQVKTPRETVKNQFTHSKNPKVDKKGLGYGFTTKACFVCGSLSHLIRDCDFHEKMMAKQVELNKKKGKDNVQRENKPVWNNVQRVNHKNQFVPRAVLTRTGKIPVSTARASGTNNVSTARHNFNSQAVLTNAARKISTVKPFVNKRHDCSSFEDISYGDEESDRIGAHAKQSVWRIRSPPERGNSSRHGRVTDIGASVVAEGHERVTRGERARSAGLIGRVGEIIQTGGWQVGCLSEESVWYEGCRGVEKDRGGELVIVCGGDSSVVSGTRKRCSG